MQMLHVELLLTPDNIAYINQLAVSGHREFIVINYVYGPFDPIWIVSISASGQVTASGHVCISYFLLLDDDLGKEFMNKLRFSKS